jgi:hypothetical protein
MFIFTKINESATGLELRDNFLPFIERNTFINVSNNLITDLITDNKYNIEPFYYNAKIQGTKT